MLYLGHGNEGKWVLEEFSGTSHTGSINTADPEIIIEDKQPWKDLGQEGIAQGFIDNIQG